MEMAPRLGKNFWIFLTGQMISTVGDACGTLALTWWILEATGSAEKISTILAPALLLKAVLTPILGPLGDRFSRKKLIIVADLIRGITLVALAILATAGTFSLSVVLSIYLVFAVASGLHSNHMSMVPQLVSPDVLPIAAQRSESIYAVGGVLGGITAGLLVTWIGVAAAFWMDALSFGIAALATAFIQVSAPEIKDSTPPSQHPLRSFLSQLRDGLRVIRGVPVLFWLCIVMAFFNLVFSPMQVFLPTYAKQAKGLPAWFLGGLEAAIGLGIIVGAASLPLLEKRPHLTSNSAVYGLLMVGGSVALLAYLPGVIAPMAIMFLLGIGAAWTNIPIGTRISVAMPDHFRARVSAIMWFVTDGLTPLGVALSGLLIGSLGLSGSMTSVGLVALLLVPTLFWIPGLRRFFSCPSSELVGHFLKTYPAAFESKKT